MLILALVSWWYGSGWLQMLVRIREHIERALDTFSLLQLLRTFFAPFRQISAGGVRGPLGVKFRAFVDRLISRFVGAFVRLIVICIGLVYLLLLGVASLLWLVVWPFIPLLPFVAFGLLVGGVR